MSEQIPLFLFDGPTNLTLIPDPSSTLSVTDTFNTLLKKCISLRSSIAFCVSPPSTNEKLLALKLSRGFLCTDIHLPTNIDWLTKMHKKEANILLHLRKPVAENILKEPTSDMPQHLLHQKISLFDNEDNSATIWIGSHNWTRRAFNGPNVETSVMINTNKDSGIYKQVSLQLENTKSLCDKFEPQMADWYKYLQGDRLYVHVVQVPRAKTTIHRSLLPTIHENVQESDALHIISLSDEDMQQIKVKTNEVVYVESDEENGEAIAFRGYIQQEGLSHNIQNIASSPKDLIILKLDDGNFELHTKQTINIGTRFYYMTLGEIQKTDAELIDNQNVQSWNLKTQDMLLERMRLCDRIVDQGQHLTKKERESLSFKPSKEHQITIKKPNTELCELIKNNGKTKFQHSQTSHLVHKRLLLQLASQSAGPVPK